MGIFDSCCLTMTKAKSVTGYNSNCNFCEKPKRRPTCRVYGSKEDILEFSRLIYCYKNIKQEEDTDRCFLYICRPHMDDIFKDYDLFADNTSKIGLKPKINNIV